MRLLSISWVCLAACFPGPLPQQDVVDNDSATSPTDAEAQDSTVVDTSASDATDASTSSEDGDTSTTTVVDVDADVGPQCPEACVPIDACHEAGVCNPSTGVCTTPATGNGKSCDDGDLCTFGDECTGGFCIGPDGPALEDWVASLRSDGDLYVTSVAATAPGEARAFMTFHAGEITNNNEIIYTTDGGPPTCGLYVLDLGADGKSHGFRPFTTAGTCNQYYSIAAWSDAHPISDDTTIFMASFDEPITTSSGGRSIGVSPTGLLIDRGFFVTRMDGSLAPLWVVTFLGFRDDAFDGYGRPTLSTNKLNASAFSINTEGPGDVREIIRDDETSEVLDVTDERSNGLVYHIDALGQLQQVARLRSDNGGVAITSVVLADDGSMAIAGFSGAAVTELTSGDDATDIPTIADSNVDGWVVVLEPNGAVRWWRHFFLPPSVPSDERDVSPSQLGYDGSHVWVALHAEHTIHARTDDATNEVLAIGPELAEGNATLVTLRGEDGSIESSVVLGDQQTFVRRMLTDRRGVIAVGRTRGLTVAGDLVGEEGAMRPFFVRPNVWAAQLARAAGTTPTNGEIMLADATPFEPVAVGDGSGGFLVAGLMVADASIGVRFLGGVQPFGRPIVAYVARIGSNGYLDCD